MAKPTGKDLRSFIRRLRMLATAEMDQRSDRTPTSEESGPCEFELGDNLTEEFTLPRVVFSS